MSSRFAAVRSRAFNRAPETAQQLIDLTKRLDREDLVTIVIVTHDLDIAAQATRRIRLKDGKVLSDERVPSDGAALGVPVA